MGKFARRVTVFLSLALAGLFTLLFWREQRRTGLGGAERDSLLPLAEEKPRPAGRDGTAPGEGVQPPEPRSTPSPRD